MGRTPYVGFDSTTLASLPQVRVGEFVICPKCGQEHPLEPPDDHKNGDPTPLLMFYRCAGTPYLGAVAGRQIVNTKPDLSGRV